MGFGGIHILLMACEEEESDLVRAALERIGAVLKADMDSINFSKPTCRGCGSFGAEEAHKQWKLWCQVYRRQVAFLTG